MGTYFVILKTVICILPGERTEVVILTTHIVISHTGAGANPPYILIAIHFYLVQCFLVIHFYLVETERK